MTMLPDASNRPGWGKSLLAKAGVLVLMGLLAMLFAFNYWVA